MQIHYDSKKTWRFFIVNISLIIILFLSGIFLGFVIRTNHIIKDQVITTARSHFKNIVLTRRWNAEHGGVYVEKVKGVISNPYLEDPDIVTIDGKTYTKKNPALMTREISEYAKQEGDFVYHITSLKPLNPGNAPDLFEQKALRIFETGIKEFSDTDIVDGKTVFRYMAPLLAEKSCLACHAEQGYVLGDVRGGISVSFDISNIQKEMKLNNIIIAAISIITAFLLIVIVFFMVSRLARKLATAHQTIALMAITDELTQLYNRRYFHSGLNQELSRAKRYQHPLSLLMLDIDYFKRINDTYGHQAGDDVLKNVAQITRRGTRESDIVARFGGEEIAIILPQTEIEGALECAEKIRRDIEARVFETESGKSLHLTVSIGAAAVGLIQEPVSEEASKLLRRADEALYEAKKSGRNRVAGK